MEDQRGCPFCGGHTEPEDGSYCCHDMQVVVESELPETEAEHIARVEAFYYGQEES